MAARPHPVDELYGCGNPRFTTPTPTLRSALTNASKPHEEWQNVLRADVGDTVHGGGTVLKDLPGAGRVYDWRDSPWTPSNGGTINPRVFVQHIPVVPNLEGIADFIRLRDVLVAQGLMVQSATDRSGNVALFTPFDSLCYQARGANSVSCGCEHMHLTVGEDWSEKQFRAAAWVANQVKNKHGIPLTNGELGSGNGFVVVLDEGQVSHRRVSQAAGFNDRIDPGDGYEWSHVRELGIYWRANSTFVGAPTL